MLSYGKLFFSKTLTKCSFDQVNAWGLELAVPFKIMRTVYKDNRVVIKIDDTQRGVDNLGDLIIQPSRDPSAAIRIVAVPTRMRIIAPSGNLVPWKAEIKNRNYPAILVHGNGLASKKRKR